jgi:hypothetical protein
MDARRIDLTTHVDEVVELFERKTFATWSFAAIPMAEWS